VQATIALATLIRDKQPKLFEFLLKMRDKREVAKLVQKAEPFVYTSGKYAGEFEKTTAAVMLTEHPENQGALVYDLRYDPTPFLKMNVEELVAAWRYSKDPEAVRLPVKTLKYNRCPAVAPLGVINDDATWQRLGLTPAVVTRHLNTLQKNQAEFVTKLLEAVARMDAEQAKAQTSLVDNRLTVDARLYDGFVGPRDKQAMRAVRTASPQALNDALANSLKDDRLKSLLPLYKARNYPIALSAEERVEWEGYCRHQLFEDGPSSRLAQYFARLQELAAGKLTRNQEYLLEELQLYGQSLVPSEAD
jgi:exodeoxyribonuclease-1